MNCAQGGRAIDLIANGNLFVQANVELPGVEMPARQALFELIMQLSVEFQLSTLYDPGTKAFFINVTARDRKPLIR